MSGAAWPNIDFRCDSLLNRVCAQPRRVEPICPPPDCVVPLVPLLPPALRRLALIDAACAAPRDRHEPLPFATFLERQNEEFRAAVDRENAWRRPCECPPCTPPDPHPKAAAHEPATPTPPAPATTASSWPRIGDVAPVPPHPHPDRLRTVQQFLPPLRPGRVIDLLL